MKAVILCYHKVGPGSEEGRWLNVEPRRLESQLRFVRRRGMEVITPSDLDGGFPVRGVVFTFDDAYESTLSNAIPIFQRHGSRAAFYAVSERVGRTSDWDAERARPLADFDTLRAAAALGHEIGAHTATHPRLAELDESAQLAEIRSCHQRLSDEGLSPVSFCYPYGSRGPTTSRLLDEIGYRVAVSLRKGVATPDDALLDLPRIVIAYGDALPLFIYKTSIRPRLRRFGI